MLDHTASIGGELSFSGGCYSEWRLNSHLAGMQWYPTYMGQAMSMLAGDLRGLQSKKRNFLSLLQTHLQLPVEETMHFPVMEKNSVTSPMNVCMRNGGDTVLILASGKVTQSRCFSYKSFLQTSGSLSTYAE